MRKFFAAVVVAVVSLLTVTSTTYADFTMQIRATAYDSMGNLLGSSAVSPVAGPFPTPPGIGSATLSGTIGDFNLVINSNISNSNFLGSGVTAHTMTANIIYSGDVYNTTLATQSEKLVVEFIGVGYETPPIGNAVVTSNASSSTGVLAANVVTFESGVSNANAGLPTIIGDTSGLVANSITSQTGTLAPNSILVNPNPDISGNFSIANPFSFYQVLTFDQFTTQGNSSISAGSVVGAPAPAGVVLALTGLPVWGVFGWLRRRKAPKTI